MFLFLLFFRRRPSLWDSEIDEMSAPRVDKIQVCTINIANILTKRRWRYCQSSRKTDRQRFRWVHCVACRNTDEICRKIMNQLTQKLGRDVKQKSVCVQASVSPGSRAMWGVKWDRQSGRANREICVSADKVTCRITQSTSRRCDKATNSVLLKQLEFPIIGIVNSLRQVTT